MTLWKQWFWQCVNGLFGWLALLVLLAACYVGWLFAPDALTLLDAHDRKSQVERLLKRGDSNATYAALQAATQRHPKNAFFWNRLGDVAFREHRWLEGQQAYEAAIKLAPGNVGLRLNYVRLLIHRKQWNPALLQLDAVAEQSPKVAAVWFQRGQLYWEIYQQAHAHNQPLLARDALRLSTESIHRSLALDATVASTWYLWGMLQQQNHQFRKASYGYCGALMRDTQHIEARQNLGELLLESLHRPKEGLALLGETLELYHLRAEVETPEASRWQARLAQAMQRIQALRMHQAAHLPLVVRPTEALPAEFPPSYEADGVLKQACEENTALLKQKSVQLPALPEVKETTH